MAKEELIVLDGKLSIILPAYNERYNIKKVIECCYSVLPEVSKDFEVIVVDDGSRDGTAKIVRDLSRYKDNLELIQHPKNLGYGQAIISGIKNAKGDFIFFMDSDGQFNFREIKKLIPYIKTYDIVAGYRIKRQDERKRLLSAFLFNLGMKVLFGIKIKDINCAFKLFCAKAIKALDLKSKGALINTEIIFKAMRNKNAIYQVGVTHSPRLFGEQTGLRPKVVLRAMYETIKFLVKLRLS